MGASLLTNMVLADFNGDGKLDLALVNNTSNTREPGILCGRARCQRPQQHGLACHRDAGGEIGGLKHEVGRPPGRPPWSMREALVPTSPIASRSGRMRRRPAKGESACPTTHVLPFNWTSFRKGEHVLFLNFNHLYK
ncbi:hypothetical protein SBA4_2150036 [Candidatus Sulfopaludibacter sp. SbA4]|nr:hypothetical protein SBA4_2150036 [Candidatus Sulfopaludibacter sp. SbA4]